MKIPGLSALTTHLLLFNVFLHGYTALYMCCTCISLFCVLGSQLALLDLRFITPFAAFEIFSFFLLLTLADGQRELLLFGQITFTTVT